MSLLDDLRADLTTAMKERDQVRTSTLRLTLSAITAAETSGANRGELDDAGVLAVIKAEMKKLVWSQPSVKHSFFKNAYGEIHGLSPWRLVDYWTWTRTPELADFAVE